MTRVLMIATLLLAAVLEAGGDALMRIGLQSSSGWRRALFFSLAAMVLFAYGWSVNAAPWSFGKLIGIYVVFFFLVAQFLSWWIFEQTPSRSLMIGGVLIVCGGVVIALNNAP